MVILPFLTQRDSLPPPEPGPLPPCLGPAICLDCSSGPSFPVRLQVSKMVLGHRIFCGGGRSSVTGCSECTFVSGFFVFVCEKKSFYTITEQTVILFGSQLTELISYDFSWFYTFRTTKQTNSSLWEVRRTHAHPPLFPEATFVVELVFILPHPAQVLPPLWRLPFNQAELKWTCA